jgi:cytochrome c-type biogenesis protein CcmF
VAWKQGSARRAWRELRGVALVSVLLTLALSVASKTSAGVATGLLLGIWVILGSLQHLRKQVQAGAGRTPLAQRWRAVPRAFFGMVVAHIGIGVFVLGVTLVKGLDHAQDASMKEGDTMSAGGYAFQFKSLEKRKGPNYIAGRATFEVSREGRHVVTLYPEKRFYVVQRMPMTEAAIDRGLTRDLYVSMAEATPDGAWGVRVQVKPFMGWVWAGCLVMALGGLLAATDRRYRRRAARTVPDAEQGQRHGHDHIAPLRPSQVLSSLS